MVQWSKAKKRAESLFAPKTTGRVELRTTNYRHVHDWEGRGWITIDGVEAWNFCTLRYCVERNELEHGLRDANQALDFSEPEQREAYFSASRDADTILERQGKVSQYYFEEAVESYPTLTVEQALASENLVHRALAMVDRRLGQRRLRILELRTDEHPLVVGLYRFRCEVEGIGKSGWVQRTVDQKDGAVEG